MDNIEVLHSGLTLDENDPPTVIQLVAELDRRWNERNAKAFADLFAPDCDFRFHTGIWIVGKQAIENFWRDQVFAGLPPDYRHASVIKRLRFVTESCVVGDGTVRIIGLIEGQERVHMDTQVTAVGVKKDGRWYFSAIRLAVLATE